MKMKPRTVTSNLIKSGNTYLLVQEAAGRAVNMWNFPAGKLENGLTLTENASKEAMEESGYKVEPTGLVGVYHDIRYDGRNVVIFVFYSEIRGGEIRSHPSREIRQAKWFTRAELDGMRKLRSPYILQAIYDYTKRGVFDLDIIRCNRYKGR